jgi:hypothetical protein
MVNDYQTGRVRAAARGAAGLGTAEWDRLHARVFAFAPPRRRMHDWIGREDELYQVERWGAHGQQLLAGVGVSESDIGPDRVLARSLNKI